MDYYPLFVDLKGRPCLVIGNTALAEEKAADLERAGAVVTRVAEFQPEAAEAAVLVVADVEGEEAARVLEFCENHRIFVNVVDKPAFCTFIMPAVMERGDLVVTVGTGGRSPALAGWIRRRFEDELGIEYGPIVAALGSTRATVKQRIPSYAGRRSFYSELFDRGFIAEARMKSGTVLYQEILAFLEAFTVCESSPVESAQSI